MEQKSQMHTLVIENKNNLKMTGVMEVLSATEKGATVKLFDGVVQVAGANLKVEKLSPEEKLVIISGTVNKVEYLSGTIKKGFFKRLFK